MAVTVLKNIKEARNRAPSAHLKNAIRYIMNPKKTEDGLWIGGNVGTDPDQVYQAMMDTKKDFGKLYGRQGYHFVISFAPEEADAETTFLIGQEFCRRYLGDAYDYAFAVHNDQKHSHCHIVFNSINRLDGNKYRYINGDWEAYIQPITDELCVARGLPPLEYDRQSRKGKSYAEHLAEKEGRITGKDIIRSDIDAAIRKAASFEEFLSGMRQMGYGIHQGWSEAKGREYYTFYAPGLEKGRRDYNLGRGYSIEDIKKRIAGEMVLADIPLKLPERMEIQNLWDRKRPGLQKNYVLRVICAVFYHSMNPYDVNQSRVRQDLLEIGRLSEECAFMEDHGIEDFNLAEEQLMLLKEKERILKGDPSEAEALKILRQEKKILRRILKRKEEYAEDVDLGEDLVRGLLEERPRPEKSKRTEKEPGRKKEL